MMTAVRVAMVLGGPWNNSDDEGDVWVSPDQRTIYLMREDRLWRSTR